MAFALADDRGAQAPPEFVRQFIEMRFPVNLDGHFGRITYDVAVVAPLKMILQFGLGLGVHRLIEVVGYLLEEFRARHFLPSPPTRFLKYLLKRSRSCNRARSSRDFTAGMLKSRASAVSSVERPSTSRNTKTVRKLGGNPWIVLLSISFSSPWL